MKFHWSVRVVAFVTLLCFIQTNTVAQSDSVLICEAFQNSAINLNARFLVNHFSPSELKEAFSTGRFSFKSKSSLPTNPNFKIVLNDSNRSGTLQDDQILLEKNERNRALIETNALLLSPMSFLYAAPDDEASGVGVLSKSELRKINQNKRFAYRIDSSTNQLILDQTFSHQISKEYLKQNPNAVIKLRASSNGTIRILNRHIVYGATKFKNKIVYVFHENGIPVKIRVINEHRGRESIREESRLSLIYKETAAGKWKLVDSYWRRTPRKFSFKTGTHKVVTQFDTRGNLFVNRKHIAHFDHYKNHWTEIIFADGKVNFIRIFSRRNPEKVIHEARLSYLYRLTKSEQLKPVKHFRTFDKEKRKKLNRVFVRTYMDRHGRFNFGGEWLPQRNKNWRKRYANAPADAIVENGLVTTIFIRNQSNPNQIRKIIRLNRVYDSATGELIGVFYGLIRKERLNRYGRPVTVKGFYDDRAYVSILGKHIPLKVPELGGSSFKAKFDARGNLISAQAQSFQASAFEVKVLELFSDDLVNVNKLLELRKALPELLADDRMTEATSLLAAAEKVVDAEDPNFLKLKRDLLKRANEIQIIKLANPIKTEIGLLQKYNPSYQADLTHIRNLILNLIKEEKSRKLHGFRSQKLLGELNAKARSELRLDLNLTPNQSSYYGLGLYRDGHLGAVPSDHIARLHRTTNGQLGISISSVEIQSLPESLGKPGDDVVVRFEQPRPDSRDLIAWIKPRLAADTEPPHAYRRLIFGKDGKVKVEKSKMSNQLHEMRQLKSLGYDYRKMPPHVRKNAPAQVLEKILLFKQYGRPIRWTWFRDLSAEKIKEKLIEEHEAESRREDTFQDRPDLLPIPNEVWEKVGSVDEVLERIKLFESHNVPFIKSYWHRLAASSREKILQKLPYLQFLHLLLRLYGIQSPTARNQVIQAYERSLLRGAAKFQLIGLRRAITSHFGKNLPIVSNTSELIEILGKKDTRRSRGLLEFGARQAKGIQADSRLRENITTLVNIYADYLEYGNLKKAKKALNNLARQVKNRMILADIEYFTDLLNAIEKSEVGETISSGKMLTVEKTRHGWVGNKKSGEPNGETDEELYIIWAYLSRKPVGTPVTFQEMIRELRLRFNNNEQALKRTLGQLVGKGFLFQYRNGKDVFASEFTIFAHPVVSFRSITSESRRSELRNSKLEREQENQDLARLKFLFTELLRQGIEAANVKKKDQGILNDIGIAVSERLSELNKKRISKWIRQLEKSSSQSTNISADAKQQSQLELLNQTKKKLVRTKELVDQGNGPAANVLLLTWAQKVGGLYLKTQEEKFTRVQQQRRVFGGQIRRDKVTRDYILSPGRYGKVSVAQDESVPLIAFKQTRFKTLWEAFRAIDHQLDSEFTSVLQAKQILSEIEAIKEEVKPYHESGEELLPSEVTQSVSVALDSLAGKLNAQWIVEKELAQLAILSAKSQLEVGNWRFAIQILHLASQLLKRRLADVEQIIERIDEGRLLALRRTTKARNDYLIKRIDLIKRGYWTYALGLSSYLQNNLEPDLRGVRELVNIARKQNRKDALNYLNLARERVVASIETYEYVKSYRSRFKQIRLSGVEEAQARDLAFREQYQEFTAQNRNIAKPHLLGYRFYQAIFISLNIDNPEKKEERISNPEFIALSVLIRMVETATIERILKQKNVFVKKKSKAGEEKTLKEFVESVKSKNILDALSKAERETLIRLIAEDRGANPDEFLASIKKAAALVTLKRSELRNIVSLRTEQAPQRLQNALSLRGSFPNNAEAISKSQIATPRASLVARNDEINRSELRAENGEAASTSVLITPSGGGFQEMARIIPNVASFAKQLGEVGVVVRVGRKGSGEMSDLSDFSFDHFNRLVTVEVRLHQGIVLTLSIANPEILDGSLSGVLEDLNALFQGFIENPHDTNIKEIRKRSELRKPLSFPHVLSGNLDPRLKHSGMTSHSNLTGSPNDPSRSELRHEEFASQFEDQFQVFNSKLIREHPEFIQTVRNIFGESSIKQNEKTGIILSRYLFSDYDNSQLLAPVLKQLAEALDEPIAVIVTDQIMRNWILRINAELPAEKRILMSVNYAGARRQLERLRKATQFKVIAAESERGGEQEKTLRMVNDNQPPLFLQSGDFQALFSALGVNQTMLQAFRKELFLAYSA